MTKVGWRECLLIALYGLVACFSFTCLIVAGADVFLGGDPSLPMLRSAFPGIPGVTWFFYAGGVCWVVFLWWVDKAPSEK